MVEPQWNMLCWRSRCIFHTVCWDAVGCEWGTASVDFGITYVCFNARIFLVFAMGPQYKHWFFYCCQEYHSNSRNKIDKGRTWGLSDKYWLSWKRLSFDVLFSCHFEIPLFHRGRVTHICVSKLTIIGSDNGLSPGRRQAIIWTNAGILLIGALATNFN